MDLLQLKQALEDSQIEKNIIECSVDEYLSVLCQYFSVLARIFHQRCTRSCFLALLVQDYPDNTHMTVDRFLFSLCLVSILVLVQILEVLKSIYAQLLSAPPIMKCFVTIHVYCCLLSEIVQEKANLGPQTQPLLSLTLAILLALTSFSRASASKWLNYDSDLDSLV